jgi:CubicO group peptidase (beta-lactamase class C family)
MKVRFPVTVSLALVLAIGAAGLVGFARQAASSATNVDKIFARWNHTTPGCAVAVGQQGRTVLERSYGMADLEHDAPIKADTIFEGGSLSKQFTAAAILLLARDGKLSLDDPAKKYIPELPDYGTPLTIRQMLTHTSGLRDWGNVVAIAGWPRTTRVHTHAHVLDVVSRQRSLNFTPGTRWSYCNTGYNLAAIIVSRVSGQSFADFTRARIFAPLGMTRTSWRDDYTRIVKDRAIAYDPRADTFVMDMPFENVHGNGGILTTVGDLLRWTRNFSTPVVGDAAFVKEEQEPGRFSDGQAHDYAFGLRVSTYKGLKQIDHSGATAGYRAYLGDYPERQLSVAVLCNAANANPTEYAHAVVDSYLGLQTSPATTDGAASKSGNGNASATAAALAGMYRRVTVGEPLTIVATKDGLELEGGAELEPQAAGGFVGAGGRTFTFGAGGRLEMKDAFGRTDLFERLSADDLRARPLGDYAGTYGSDEAEVTMAAAVDGDTLVLQRRPDSVIRLTPVYADAFRGSIGFVTFHRNSAGRVEGFSITQDRVWDLRFKK